MILSLVETIKKWDESIKMFIQVNYNQPLMWFGFVLIGIMIFGIVYDTLHPNGD